MPVQVYKTKISAKEQIAENTFLLKIPLEKEMLFEAGQFVNVLVAPNIRRSYSIASAPVSTTSIDLIGDRVIGGPGSQFFGDSVVGQEVEFLGPLGKFVYKEQEKPVYFFATGTGLVPFISMVSHALEALHTQRDVKLFIGFRHQATVFYKEYFEALASRYPNFELVLTLSQPDESWQGKRGRITEYYPQVVEQNKDIDAYICGSQKMIDDVAQTLATLGVPQESIYYEKYY